MTYITLIDIIVADNKTNKKGGALLVNSELLNKKITETGKTRKYLAFKCGIAPQTLWNKVNNIHDFTSTEVLTLCKELNIRSLSERERIFFAQKVE